MQNGSGKSQHCPALALHHGSSMPGLPVGENGVFLPFPSARSCHEPSQESGTNCPCALNRLLTSILPPGNLCVSGCSMATETLILYPVEKTDPGG